MGTHCSAAATPPHSPPPASEGRASLRQRLYRLPIIGSLLALAYLIIRPQRLMDRLHRLEAADQQRPHQDSTRDVQIRAELMAQVGQLRAEREDHVAQALEQIQAELMAQVGQLRAEREDHVAQALAQIRAELMAQVGSLQTELTVQVSRLRVDLAQLADAQASALELAQVKQGVSELAGQIQGLAQHLEGELTQVKVLADTKANSRELRIVQDQIKHDFSPMRQQLYDYRRALVDQQRRLGLLLEETRKRLPAPLDAAQMATLVQEDDHRLDALYVSFEDHFRGTRSEIQQHLHVYLPHLRQAGVGGDEDPILDIGCGRGEWLELLTQQGLVARGLDRNRVMVAECRERGLLVDEADVLVGLRALPDASLGAVTGFHIIEHLPLAMLVSLLDEALRVVRPGGLLILETPNPENLRVSGYNFYFDPTHRHPLPPLLSQFLLEGRGWTPVEILRLNPYPDHQRFSVAGGQSQVTSWLNEVFCGPQDYSVIGHKP